MSRYLFQRPENAISKADEFIKVGKASKALDSLYEVIKVKKRGAYLNVPESLVEQIMSKYLELCVDLRKSHAAKEGLFQYRIMFQSTNVATLATVVQLYLNMAEKRTENARQESIDSVANVDDLEDLTTPQMIMLSAVTGEDAQNRSDRKILRPWVKFLWDSYCQCLEVLRTNNRLERLYHDIAQQAFKFCFNYQRKTEFRKLCDKLRLHFELVLKQAPSPTTIDLFKPETQQLNLDTRLVQLDVAIQMELWQEAYKAIEDINGLMALSKKAFHPKMISNYYNKLDLVFLKAGNHLFHAAAVFKHFQLAREMKKGISSEELSKMASKVLVSILAIPLPSQHPEFDKVIESDRSTQDKMGRLAALLSLQQAPTRNSLIKDAYRFGIVNVAMNQAQELYKRLEVEFDPLNLCDKVSVCLESEEMSQLSEYIPALKEVTLVRLLKQVSQVYQSICFNRLLSLAPFADALVLERIIVESVRHNDMQIRIDHRTQTIHFGRDLTEVSNQDYADGPHLQDMPSEQVRTQLMVMMDVLDKSIKVINPNKVKDENNLTREKLVDAYLQSRQRDHERILQRQKTIEDRKEFLEKKAKAIEAEEDKKKEQHLKEQQELEAKRLQSEREERELKKRADEIKQIQMRHIKEKVEQISQTDIGKKVLGNMDEKEIAQLDADQIMERQIIELEKEKKELSSRLKAQEKRFDHFERAKRQEEIPLLEESFLVDEEQDKIYWAKKEEARIEKAKLDREAALKTKARMLRMKNEKDLYVSKLLKERREDFQKKLVEFNEELEKARKVRLQERKARRKANRKAEWEQEQREKEQRKIDERLRMEREKEQQALREMEEREAEAFKKKKAELDAIEEAKQSSLKAAEARREITRDEPRKQADGPLSWRSSGPSKDKNYEERKLYRGPESRGNEGRNFEDLRRRDYSRRDDMRRDEPMRRDGPIRRDEPMRRDDMRRDEPMRRDDMRRDEPMRRDDMRRDEPMRRGDMRRDDMRRDDHRDHYQRRPGGFSSHGGGRNYNRGVGSFLRQDDNRPSTGSWRREKSPSKAEPPRSGSGDSKPNPDDDDEDWITVKK